MSTVIKPAASQIISGGSAANADKLADPVALSSSEVGEVGIETVIEPAIGSTGGWDAYEVWRRLIKDARDRRKHRDPN